MLDPAKRSPSSTRHNAPLDPAQPSLLDLDAATILCSCAVHSRPHAVRARQPAHRPVRSHAPARDDGPEVRGRARRIVAVRRAREEPGVHPHLQGHPALPVERRGLRHQRRGRAPGPRGLVQVPGSPERSRLDPRDDGPLREAQAREGRRWPGARRGRPDPAEGDPRAQGGQAPPAQGDRRVSHRGRHRRSRAPQTGAPQGEPPRRGSRRLRRRGGARGRAQEGRMVAAHLPAASRRRVPRQWRTRRRLGRRRAPLRRRQDDRRARHARAAGDEDPHPVHERDARSVNGARRSSSARRSSPTRSASTRASGRTSTPSRSRPTRC